MFWAPIVAGLACLFISVGLAELASAFPSSGGQYHYMFMVSGPRYRALAAYIIGWLSVLSWLFASCSLFIYTAKFFLSLATFYNPGYTATQWQEWLIYVALIIICTLMLCLLPQLVYLWNSLIFWVSVLGFLISVIALLAASDIKQSSSVVFLEWVNQTGWDNGVAFLLAVGQGMYSFMCLDAATHLSDQLQNPSRDVPRAILGAVVIGLVTIIPYSVAILFSTHEFAPILASDLPILEVYHQALSSRAGATALAVILLFINIGGCTVALIGVSYLIRAFARDNGIPFSKVFSKIHPNLQMPVNAMILNAIFLIIYGLLYIGSTEAFNSFISSSILTLYITLVVPQGIALWRGRDRVLPERQFNLGRIFGPLCNLFSCLWMSLYTVVFCLPFHLPASVKTMNYVCVVVIGSLIFIGTLWILQGKRSFVGPQCVDFGLEAWSGQDATSSSHSSRKELDNFEADTTKNAKG